MGTCSSGRGGAGGGGAGGAGGGTNGDRINIVPSFSGALGRAAANDFMDAHNASQFSFEQFEDVAINGAIFRPFSFATQGDKIINTYQAQSPNARGEYALFQTVVTRHNYKRGTVYKWDRSSIGTKFD